MIIHSVHQSMSFHICEFPFLICDVGHRMLDDLDCGSDQAGFFLTILIKLHPRSLEEVSTLASSVFLFLCFYWHFFCVLMKECENSLEETSPDVLEHAELCKVPEERRLILNKQHQWKMWFFFVCSLYCVILLMNKNQ